MKLSKEWCNYDVYFSKNEPTSVALSSYRRKIYNHKMSDAHQQAQLEIEKHFRDNNIAMGFLASEKHVDVITANVMRTAYYCAKNNRPYSDQPGLINLQQLYE